MDNYDQMVFFFVPIVVSVFFTSFYGYFRFGKTEGVKKIIFETFVINLFIFLLAVFIYAAIVNDGIAAFVAMMIYIASFVVINIIAALVLYFVNKHSK